MCSNHSIQFTTNCLCKRNDDFFLRKRFRLLRNTEANTHCAMKGLSTKKVYSFHKQKHQGSQLTRHAKGRNLSHRLFRSDRGSDLISVGGCTREGGCIIRGGGRIACALGLALASRRWTSFSLTLHAARPAVAGAVSFIVYTPACSLTTYNQCVSAKSTPFKYRTVTKKFASASFFSPFSRRFGMCCFARCQYFVCVCVET